MGATEVRQELGLDGAGIGIAVIDSGIAYHDDLADASGPQRVDRFVDFVGGQSTPYDDYGHGTHVAGIIAGNGYDSGGKRTGIAPAARLIALKALDGTGTGRMLQLLAPRAQRTVGLDASHAMLSVARANLEKAGLRGIELRQGDIYAPPFPRNTFDLVVIHQVLHYLDDPARAIREAARRGQYPRHVIIGVSELRPEAFA